MFWCQKRNLQGTWYGFSFEQRMKTIAENYEKVGCFETKLNVGDRIDGKSSQKRKI